VVARSERLLELEQVVASLNAAAYVVDAARNRTAAWAETVGGGAGGIGGGEPLQQHEAGQGAAGLETCTALVGGEGKERQLCLKVQTGERRSNTGNVGYVDGEGDHRRKKPDFYLSVAGASMIVWAFVIVADRRRFW
jgi:hypothetical protein